MLGPQPFRAEVIEVGLRIRVKPVSATCHCIDALDWICAILPHSVVSQLFFNADLDESRKDCRVTPHTLPYADWVTFSSWRKKVLPLLWDDSILKTASETGGKCSWECNTPPCQKHISEAGRLDPLSQDAPMRCVTVTLVPGSINSTPYIEDGHPTEILRNPYNGYI